MQLIGIQRKQFAHFNPTTPHPLYSLSEELIHVEIHLLRGILNFPFWDFEPGGIHFRVGCRTWISRHTRNAQFEYPQVYRKGRTANFGPAS
jgi:hypothetical protein